MLATSHMFLLCMYIDAHGQGYGMHMDMLHVRVVLCFACGCRRHITHMATHDDGLQDDARNSVSCCRRLAGSLDAGILQ